MGGFGRRREKYCNYVINSKIKLKKETIPSPPLTLTLHLSAESLGALQLIFQKMHDVYQPSRNHHRAPGLLSAVFYFNTSLPGTEFSF